MDIITRKQALSQGLKRYFTGKPCKHGHVAERWTKERSCIDCISDFHARWYAKNRTKKLADNRQWASENPEASRAKTRRWRERNPEAVAVKNSEWQRNNPERRRDLDRQKRAAAPAVYLAHQANRRARRAGVTGSHTAADLASIFKAQRGRCAYCRSDLKLGKHVDHIIPLARGGSNDRSNLQYLCPSCNCAKGAKDPAAFARERGFLI